MPDSPRFLVLADAVHQMDFMNGLIITNALFRNGVDVRIAATDSLFLADGRVGCLSARVQRELRVGDSVVAALEATWLDDSDCVWVLGLGTRASFLDKIQLLWIASRRVRVINSIEAILHLNNKYSLSLLDDLCLTPRSYASSSFDYLWAVYREGKSSTWVVKPPADSKGRNVFLLREGDSNVRGLLQAMTSVRGDAAYTILQEYIEGIRDGEKRVLLSGGEVVGQYLRVHSAEDHRTNLFQGAVKRECALTDDEARLCRAIAARLLAHEIYYAGLDLVYPYLLEVNIVNPGGLNSIHELTGEDLSDQAIRLLLGSLYGVRAA